MRNVNSPNHGSYLQHIKHQAKTSLISRQSFSVDDPIANSAIQSQNVRDTL